MRISEKARRTQGRGPEAGVCVMCLGNVGETHMWSGVREGGVVATARTLALFYMIWGDMAGAGAQESHNSIYTSFLRWSKDRTFQVFSLEHSSFLTPGAFQTQELTTSLDSASLNIVPVQVLEQGPWAFLEYPESRVSCLCFLNTFVPRNIFKKTSKERGNSFKANSFHFF